MTHEERLALIHRPFFITYMGPSYFWAGTIIGDSFPKGNDGRDLLHDEDGFPFGLLDDEPAWATPTDAGFSIVHPGDIGVTF